MFEEVLIGGGIFEDSSDSLVFLASLDARVTLEGFSFGGMLSQLASLEIRNLEMFSARL